MANLLGQNVGTNYKGMLNLGSTINTPLDGTLRYITDGEGNESPLKISTSEGQFDDVFYFGTRRLNTGLAKVISSYAITGASDTSEHSFVEYSEINKGAGAGTMAFAAYDAATTFIGTYDYDHYVSYQGRGSFNSSGTMLYLYGFQDAPNMSSGTVTNRFGVRISSMVVTGGTLTNQYGIYVDSLNTGTNRYA